MSGGSLQIGDRVIVASGMAGTKTGTLRYLGPAHFAKGEWAGIELDAALGGVCLDFKGGLYHEIYFEFFFYFIKQSHLVL